MKGDSLYLCGLRIPLLGTTALFSVVAQYQTLTLKPFIYAVFNQIHHHPKITKPS